MKKRMTSLVLALVMCMTLAVPAMAAEHGSEFGIISESEIQAEIQREKDRIFSSVYEQLEAQNALGLMGVYEEILTAKIETNVKSQYGLTETRSSTYVLSNGGVIGYISSLGATVVETYMTNTQYADHLHPIAMSIGSFTLKGVLESISKKIFGGDSYYTSIISGWGTAFSLVMLIKSIADGLTEKDVIKAGGYAIIMNVSDGIEQGSVTLGWDNHPYARITAGFSNLNIERF